MRRLVVLLLLISVVAAGCAGFDAGTLDGILKTGEGPLDEPTVAAGLREALRVGTQRATDSTSRVDGFFGNALIRIAVPQQYRGVASTLRDLGLGSKVDEFELSMNRAAEAASGEAFAVFRTAIARMTIADAFAILGGGKTAATDYFREQTAAELKRRFQPIVSEKMEAVGVYRVYNDLTARYDQLPVEKPPAVDLDEYITGRAVDGIFTVLAGEEQRIREDPVARTTALLRKVFGASNADARP